MSRTVSHPLPTCLFDSLMPLVPNVRQSRVNQAIMAGLKPPRIPPGPQPNTTVKICLYDVESFPAASSPLNANAWYQLLEGYPGNPREDLQGMIRHGARIGYELRDDLRRTSRRLERNLPMTEGGSLHVEREIAERLQKGSVLRAAEDEHVVTSPLGAVPKPAVDGVEKSRTIHHLSWSKVSKTDSSVNARIDSNAITLHYSDIEVLLRALGEAARRDPQNLEGRYLWKVDLTDAYRHVVVEQRDARLLAYFWPTYGYPYETHLSFGGKPAPSLFNLVAEGFEWVLTSMGVSCDHYLADSLVMNVWSDASGLLGIGGHLVGNADEFAERIPARHTAKDIIFKEALAVLRCVDRWKDRMHRRLVVLNVDNQELVATLNKGSCKLRPTQAYAGCTP